MLRIVNDARQLDGIVLLDERPMIREARAEVGVGIDESTNQNTVNERLQRRNSHSHPDPP